VERFDGREVPWPEVPADEVIYVIALRAFRWVIPSTSARYLNHSCDPNCRVLADGEVRTVRPVAEGEDLTIDYEWADAADAEQHPDHYFWDDRWSFPCRCGAATCRGVVARYRPS